MKNYYYLAIKLIIITLIFTIKLPIYSQTDTLDLNKALEIALKTHPLIKSGELIIQATEKENDIIDYDYLPLIGTSLNLSRWNWVVPNKAKFLGNSLNDLYADLHISQLIYNGGRSNLQKEINLNKLSYEKLNQKRLIQSLTYTVSKNYLQILKAKRVISVYEETLSELTEQLKTSEALYNIGKVSYLDVLKINVQRALIEDEISKATNSLEIHKYNFNNSLGVDINGNYEVKDIADLIWESYKDKEFDIKNLVDELKFNHPDLAKNNLDLEFQDKNINLLKADYYPAVHAFGVTNVEDGVFPMGNFNWNLGVSLSYNIPIFQGNRFNEKIQQIEISKQAILSNEASLKLKLELNLQNYISQLYDSKTRIQSSIKIIELAKQSLRTSILKYGIGQGISQDIIDAQTILTSAEITYSQNLLDYLTMIVEINYAIGKNEKPFDY